MKLEKAEEAAAAAVTAAAVAAMGRTYLVGPLQEQRRRHAFPFVSSCF